MKCEFDRILCNQLNLEYTCPIETFVPESIVTEIGDSPHEKAIIHLKGHLYIPSITFSFFLEAFSLQRLHVKLREDILFKILTFTLNLFGE